VAFFVVRKGARSTSDNESSTSSYFLGGRDLGWIAIAASLFASNIGSEHLVGLAGQGAAGNFVASQFEIIASFMLLLLGWLFVPFYLRTGVFTMPEFLEVRYSVTARNYLSWVSIVGYILTKISVTIAAGGIVFVALLGVDFWTGAIAIVLITGAYTVLGGLKAVIYTDLVQMFILIGGSIVLTIIGLDAVGGVEGMRAHTSAEHLSLWRGLEDPDYPWTGILFGAPILGVWYWCTDQFIVQRVLAAKDLSNARRGSIVAGYLKLLPMFIFVLPGVIAFALASDPNSGFTFPLTDGKEEYDAALPLLINHLLPSGLRGLVIAGLLAALMSSLSSVFNSCSTLFTIDIYKKWRPSTTDKNLVRVGQLVTAVLVVLGLAWIPMLQVIEGGLFQKLQSIQAYIAPPIAAVFLMGILSKRVNNLGALAALFSGAIIGTLRLTLEINKASLSGIWLSIADINFLHFALFLFLICTAVLFVVSYATKEDGRELGTFYRPQDDVRTFNKLNIFLSAGLVLAVLVLWLLFV
jgi:solute:Na+ symporter, SSS family